MTAEELLQQTYSVKAQEREYNTLAYAYRDGTATQPTMTDQVNNDVKNYEDLRDATQKASWLVDDPDGLLGYGLGDKSKAVGALWNKNWAGSLLSAYEYDNGSYHNVDEKFKEEYTHEKIQEDLLANNLPETYYGRLKEAENDLHRESLLKWSIRDVQNNQLIRNSLDTYEGIISEATLANVATSLLDVDVAITGGFGLAAKLTGLGKMMAAGAAGTHLGTAYMVQENSNGEISAAEAAGFGLLGAFIDGAIIGRIGRTTAQPSPTPTNVQPQGLLPSPTPQGLLPSPTPQGLLPYYDNDFVRKAMLEDLSLSPSNTRLQHLAERFNAVTIKDRLLETKVLNNTIASRQQELSILKKEITDKKRLRNKQIDLKLKADENAKIVALEKRLAKKTNDVNNFIIQSQKKLMQSQRIDSGFKGFNAKVNKIIDDVQTQKQLVRAEVLRQTQKDLAMMADDLEVNKAEWKKYIDDSFKNKDEQAIADLDNIVNDLYNKGYMLDGEYQAYKNKLNTGRFEPPTIKAKMNNDGSFTLQGRGKKGSKAKKIVVSGLLVTGLAGELMADDGSGVTTGGVAALVLGGLAAGIVLKNFKGIANTVKEVKLLDRSKKTRRTLEEIIDSLKTSLTETRQPLMKDGNPEFTSFIDRILFNPDRADTLSVERNRSAIYHRFSNTMKEYMTTHYHEWLKESGLNKVQGAMSNLSFNGIRSKRLEFDNMVAEFVEQGKHSDKPSVVAAGAKVREQLKAIEKEMVDSGVKGAENMAKHFNEGDSYLPRYFRSEELAMLWRSIDKTSKETFVQNFAKMMDGDVDKARLYLGLITQIKQSKVRITNLKDIEDFLKNNNITTITVDEAADALGVSSSQLGRTKARIKLDKSKFTDFEIKLADGSKQKVTLDNIFVSDVTDMMDRYYSNVSGHIAFADAGFKSLDEARDMASRARQPKNQITANEIIDLLTGQPILDLSSDAARLLQTGQSLTVVGKMGFSVISLFQEIFNGAVKAKGSGFGSSMVFLKNTIFKIANNDRALLNEFMELTGSGMHSKAMSYGTFKSVGADNLIEGSGAGAIAGMEKVSMIARDIVLNNLGLIPFSDAITKAHLIDSSNYLYKVVNGLDTMTPFMKQTIGLTPEIEKMLKTNLKGIDGKLTASDIKNWNRADRMNLLKVIDSMMQKRIQQTTLGGTPHWARRDALGAVLTQLIKFPLQAFSNHGLYDLKGLLVHKDPMAMMSMFSWFAGGYISSMIRAELGGKEVSEDELMMRALLSTPMTGFLSIPNAFTSGVPMFDTFEDFSNTATGVIGTMGE